jgi:hypothetical protein
VSSEGSDVTIDYKPRKKNTLLKITADFYTSRHILDIWVSAIIHANIFSATLKNIYATKRPVYEYMTKCKHA